MPGPSILRLATEVAAVGELGAFTMSAPLVKRWLPGATGPCSSCRDSLPATAPPAVARTLDRLGHTTYGWDLGRNLGPTPEILDGIVERIDELHQKHGPIDVVGWSLGGIFARELAGLRRTRSDR